MPSLHMTDRKNAILSAVHVSRLDRVKRLKNLVCASDSVNELVRCTTVTSLANDGDLNLRYCCKKWTFTNSYVALIKVWDVVKAIDFVNSLQASFFNHRFSTAWSLFSRLEQKSDALALGDFIQVFLNDLSAGQKTSHVTVMATHMSMVCLRPVREIFGIFRDGETINVSSQSDHVYTFRFTSFGSNAFEINNKTRDSRLLDRFIFDTETFQRVDQGLRRPELFKAAFWMRVKLLSYSDDVVDVPSSFIHC